MSTATDRHGKRGGSQHTPKTSKAAQAGTKRAADRKIEAALEAQRAQQSLKSGPAMGQDDNNELPMQPSPAAAAPMQQPDADDAGQ